MEFNSLLTQEAHEEGAEVQIVNPNTGEKTDVFIKVLGPDSKEFRTAVKVAMRKAIANSAKDDPEDDTETDIEQIAAATIGWRGIMSEGKELPFTKKQCKDLYRKAPSILDQVNRFIGNYRNFTKG